MAIKTFSSIVEFHQLLEPIIEKAVSNTCNRLLGTLQQLIMSEYYDLYLPVKYDRSFQFFESATTKMLNMLTGEIFMDSQSMNYSSYWDGETQLYMANAGYHGNSYIYEDGHYWNTFIKFCEKNAVNILKEELKKQGLNIV